jgi:2-polyprenyl-6-methoxyphenol hydroxylase-like FAD-dependent oxidoreductase
MRVLIVGAGPAELLAALLLKKGNSRLDVTLIDRRAPAERPGSGIVLSADAFQLLRRVDLPVFHALHSMRVRWTTLAVVCQRARVSRGGNRYAWLSTARFSDRVFERAYGQAQGRSVLHVRVARSL